MHTCMHMLHGPRQPSSSALWKFHTSEHSSWAFTWVPVVMLSYTFCYKLNFFPRDMPRKPLLDDKPTSLPRPWSKGHVAGGLLVFEFFPRWHFKHLMYVVTWAHLSIIHQCCNHSYLYSLFIARNRITWSIICLPKHNIPILKNTNRPHFQYL